MKSSDNDGFFSGIQPGDRKYVLIAAIAFGGGAFFRFWGLGEAPLAVDEYFFGTSMLNIVARGWPEFPCGGFYTRGILIQYLSVPLLYLGATLEFTTRFWPAVTSLLAVVAAWSIGRLAGGVKAAAVAVILVSLSVWEIEFARFGRMYSPFQAVFLWYIYFQMLHLMHGSNRARWAYIALSAVSIFVYAGASFLLVMNFLALVWKGKRWSAAHLLVAGILLIFGVRFYMTDFRFAGVSPEAAPPATGDEPALSLPINIPALPDSALPIVIVATLFIIFALLRYWPYLRLAHASVPYWAISAVSICFGLFGLGLGLLVAGLLMKLPPPVSETGRNGFRVPLGLAVGCAVWLAILMSLFVIDGGGFWANVKDTLTYVFLYPDIYHYVFQPWWQAIPVTTAVLLFLAAPQLWLLLVTQRQQDSDELRVQRYCAAVLILLLMLSAVFRQPYTITRYTYFLYPLILIFVSAAIVHWSTSLFKGPRLRTAGLIAPVALLFAITEDFRLAHLFRINEPEIQYRMVYDYALGSHYYTRWDFRSPAAYVNERLEPADSVIVFEQPLPHYLNRTSGIFLRYGSENHSIIWGCGGTRDLWSNAPLLDTDAEVLRLMNQTNGSVWLIMRTDEVPWQDRLEVSLPARYRLEPEYVSTDRHLAVYRLPPD